MSIEMEIDVNWNGNWARQSIQEKHRLREKMASIRTSQISCVFMHRFGVDKLRAGWGSSNVVGGAKQNRNEQL